MTAAFAIVGAGGLGGPVALVLAAAGARRLVLCDHDRVELGNLQRQVQFTTASVGRPKVEALADELVRRGADRAAIEPLALRFAPDTAARVLEGIDVAIEATDDPATKFAFNDAAVARGRPFAIGAVERRSGQVFVGRGRGCYRCLFEAPPGPDEAPSCAAAGVLGAAVAVVGGLLGKVALELAGMGDGGSGIGDRGMGDRGSGMGDGGWGTGDRGMGDGGWGIGDRGAGMLLVLDDVAVGSEPRVVRYNPRPGCPTCQP